MNKETFAVIKEPGKAPRAEEIELSLENLQQIVGGHIEVFTISNYACFICNEEGLLLGLPYNFIFAGNLFVGTVILIGVHYDDFKDLPITFEETKSYFPEMFNAPMDA